VPGRGSTLEAVHALAALAALATFVLPGFAPVATDAQGGQLLTGTFPGTKRPGYVYLPPHFNPKTRYPVVFLLHGLPGSPSEYVDGVQAAAFADREIAQGKLSPFIAVIPAAGDDAGYGGEWAGPWEQALVDQVLPWVDAQLPVRDDRAGRILAGLSAGGFGAVNVALRHPGLFGAVESWSGYFTPLRDGPFAHASKATLTANDPILLARADASKLRRERVRFYLSTGPLHSSEIDPKQTRTFADELRGLGVDVAYRSYPTLKGEWRGQFDAGLLWALGR
jgi:enterochelin esterase-like enzyme